MDANTSLKIFHWDTSSPAVVNIVAFVAGFSERFITGAIERIALVRDKKES